MNGNANKAAMSRALGAAFLSHQVEQLEKSVSGNGPSSGNWRDRKTTNLYSPNSAGGPKRAPNSPNPKVAQRRKADVVPPTKVAKDAAFERTARPICNGTGKDADIVVVDASVLIHALYQVKKWCRDGREEVIIVPLEALNTLDLLKKGTSTLAQKARAASRILEAQVGTNPRIRVQRDDAFVLWDDVTSNNDAEATAACPEWVRRIICCASWETKHAQEELEVKATPNPKVILAVVTSPPNTSPQMLSHKLAEMSVDAPLTPVPLPAPTQPHASRFETRSTGTLVASWAGKANIQLLEVDPALPGRGAGGGGEDVDVDRQKRSHGHSHVQRNSGGGRRPSTGEHGPKPALVERPPAVMAMMEIVSQPSKTVRVLARGEKLDPDP
ncbi:hypothetical protein D9613_009075 [Agrocybe pediades]|uniref:PIN domain-containing protein n=1 Tax=Agrocybe pediades TaxID=84607 RepID=A0A8H4R3Q5_9AGAR|nr:hypothetical protein D9613_009075 [Agrocybe pediades]